MNSNKILQSSIKPSVPIILASGSESRRIMLEDAGLDFKVISSEVDEDILKQQMTGMPFEEQVVKLAMAKAKEVSEQNQDHVVIGGDQMCVCNNSIFDKPGSVEKAVNNLQVLSGTTHYQYSGVCIFKNGALLWDYYVKLENPIHAAGAYKFESLGCNLFSSVNGSSYTIRGMPLLPLLGKLREMEVINLEQIDK
jgi:septum formation protein